MLFQPGIQRRQIWKVRHLLPQAWSGILDVLLDLTLLPTRGGITELGRKDVVVRHRQEADVRSLPRPTRSTAVFMLS